MKKDRVTFQVSVNLDPVPGWGDNPEDWRELILRHLLDVAPHYLPTIDGFEVRQVETVFDPETGKVSLK